MFRKVQAKNEENRVHGNVRTTGAKSAISGIDENNFEKRRRCEIVEKTVKNWIVR